jgi:hypothetical protein
MFVTAFDLQKEEIDLKIMMPSALNNNNEKPAVIRKPISIDDFVERVKAEIPLQNISQSSSRQIHFLICETCFWCVSLLYQIPDRTKILNWHKYRSYIDTLHADKSVEGSLANLQYKEEIENNVYEKTLNTISET